MNVFQCAYLGLFNCFNFSSGLRSKHGYLIDGVCSSCAGTDSASVVDSGGDVCNAAKLPFLSAWLPDLMSIQEIGPLQLVFNALQIGHTGEQETQWDKRNKGHTSFNMVITLFIFS